MSVTCKEKNTTRSNKEDDAKKIKTAFLAEFMTRLFLLFIFLATALFIFSLGIGASYMSYLTWMQNRTMSAFFGVCSLFLFGVTGAIVFSPLYLMIKRLMRTRQRLK